VPKDVSVSSTIQAFRGAGYFVGSETGGAQGALFRSDGTAEGTFALGGSALKPPDEWAVAGDHLYFISGGDLWTTDGTPQGTVVLLDQPASLFWTIFSLAAVGDELYFSAYDPDHGRELWKTDGTVAGTQLAEDVWPGVTDSIPLWLTNVGGTLYFSAADPTHGNELRRLDLHPRIVGRHVFYSEPPAAPGGPPAGAPADSLVADKTALLPGGTASFANVTSNDRGITGILIDAFGLPPGFAPAAADVSLDVLTNGQWSPAPAPPSITLRPSAGAGGSDRLALTLPDNSARNTWLRVTVNADANTGLASPDVFYFGNLVGDAGNDRGAPTVNATDYTLTRAAVFKTDAASLNSFDFNRDGKIDAADVLIVRNNQRHSLPPFTAPPAVAPAQAPAAAAQVPAARGRSAARPARRSAWEELTE
jgi:ELWxxDGT repeat protein